MRYTFEQYSMTRPVHKQRIFMRPDFRNACWTYLFTRIVLHGGELSEGHLYDRTHLPLPDNEIGFNDDK